MQMIYKQTQLVECRSLVSPISGQLVVVTAAMLSAPQMPKTTPPVYSHGALTLSSDIDWTPAWPEKINPQVVCLNGFATISWQRRTPRLGLANMCSQTRRLHEQAQTLTHACARFTLQGSDQPHEHPHPNPPDHPWPPRPNTTNKIGGSPLFIPGGCSIQ